VYIETARQWLGRRRRQSQPEAAEPLVPVQP
jgi:hypothetical protein